ncbi:hypothetical protein ACIQC8_07640 [Agrococcus sediminis]|uniref:hypothetical protein n=1 Tax=Agrococcus sediminis TaxID=2599924 RepID=UPI003817C3C3
MQDTPTIDRDAVRALGREALERLAQAAGDRSMCAISRDGRPHVAAKYHEGAVSALAEVRRGLPAGAAADSTAELVRAALDRWTAQAERNPDAPAWVAYAAGGRDALARLLQPRPPAPVPAASPAARTA